MENKSVKEVWSMHRGGTDGYYNHPLGIIFTDGIKDIADTFGAWWLVDLVASWQGELKGHRFQVFSLTKTNETEAVVKITDGNENKIGFQEIPYTDFPEDITIWCVDNVCLLPVEY